MGALDKFRTPRHAGMTHTRSYEQLPEGEESAQLPPQYGGGYYIRKKQELEAPFIDPTLPAFLGGTVPKNIGNLLASAAKSYGRAGAEAVARGMEGEGALAQLVAASRPSYVVKPKGGNWLTGSVEDALAGLKNQPLGDEPARRLQMLEEAHRLMSPDQLTPDVVARFERERKRLGGVSSLNSWIEGPLTKYVKTRMASPDDELRKLAEQGVLHFEPAMIRERSPLMEKVVGRRETAGFPIQGIADSPLARSWENTSDSSLRNLTALDLSAAERASTFGGKTVPKDTVVHEMNPFASGAGISDLGFPHLIDELSNALRPDSDLPRHLRLTPEAVQNLSMEKAVRRVADINAWRAAQKAEANRSLAEQASVLREYPHSEATPNPKGLRWVELKANPKTDEHGMSLSNGERELADQLKYEGDTMGHCVGGYCDDVLSGRSRIFSLRDAKGEPHVTVEVSPQPRNIGQQDIPDRYVEDAMERLGIDSPEAQWGREEEIDKLAGDLFRKDNPNTNRIVQIKGKQNRAPNPEYLPFVQDFVRNNPLGGQWSEVGDLQNTGLRRTIDAFNSNELKKISEAGIDVPQWASPDDISNIRTQVWGEDILKKADGGSVAPPETKEAIIPASWDIFFTE